MDFTVKARLLIFCFVIVVSKINSQINLSSTINISGGSNTLNNFTLEWNVGESADIATMQSSNYMLTNGLLQFSTIRDQSSQLLNQKSIAESWLTNQIKIYPNPFKTNLEIIFSSDKSDMVKMTIFGINNHFIASKSFRCQVATNHRKWRLNLLAAGQYTVYIQQIDLISGNIIKLHAFKIIKLD